MNFISLLAQTPTLTPAVTVTATAGATVTPTPTPTATPFHVVIEHEPFWNSWLGILIVIALPLAAGVLVGWLVAQKGSFSSVLERLFASFTDMLAYWVVILAFLGIFLLGYVVLSHDRTSDTTKYVFAAVLPLLGTWVGTVLAHYFQKENLAAANQSISDLVKTVSTPGKLASLPVKDYMIGPGKIITLPVELQGMKDSEIPLRAIVDHLNLKQRDRLPLFADNKGSGSARCVIHLSKIQKFLAGKVLPPATISPPSAVAGGAQGGGTAGAGAAGGGAAGGGAAGGGAADGGAAGGGATGGGAASGGAAGGGAAGGGAAGGGAAGGGAAPLTSIEQLAELTLGDLLREPMDPLFKSSFSLVKESATLAETKAAMDSMTSAPGVPGNCYDIFVTATGSATEPVLGWITNDIINQNANV